MALLWGAEAHLVWTVKTTDDMVRQVDSALLNRGVCHPHDLVDRRGRHAAGDARVRPTRSGCITSATSCAMTSEPAGDLGRTPAQRQRGRGHRHRLRRSRGARPTWARSSSTAWSGCSTSRRSRRTSTAASARRRGGSGCSAARSPGRRWWPPAAPCQPTGTVHSLHSYFIRPGDPSRADRLRGRPDARRPVVHAPVASSRCSTASRSSRCRRRSSSISRASTTSRRCPTRRAPESLPTLEQRYQDSPDAAAFFRMLPRPIDLRYVDDPPWQQHAKGPRVGRDPGVDAGERAPARRSAAARLRADLRLGHDAARLGPRPPRAGARPRPDLDGLPGSRDVVPAAVSRRRVAAVRDEVAVSRPAVAGWRPDGSSPRTAATSPASCRRA